jgi:hypothetical protein
MRRRFVLGVLLAAVLWLGWTGVRVFGRSFERQVLDAQEALIRAAERRDWEAVRGMLTDDYMDEAGQDRALAVENGRQALAPFFTLTLRHEVTKVLAVKDVGMVHCRIKMEGTGAGYSEMVVNTVNGMTEPWVFHWHKKGRWPWDWKAVQIHHDQLAARARADGFR